MTAPTITKPAPKDRTGAERQRRYKAERKAQLALAVTSNAPLPAVTAEPVTVTPRVEVLPPRHSRRYWSAIGRVTVGSAIIATGAWIAVTSMRGNAWFGPSLTPDPAAGEIYSHLSVAAEVMACLIPTAVRFYWQNGEALTALRGWALMAVALVVVFFAAGGFAVTNISAGIGARAERQTGEVTLAQRRLDTLSKSRDAGSG